MDTLEYSGCFIVNMPYLFIRKCFKISLFRTILPCRFVCVLKAPFSHLRRVRTEVGRKAEQALLYRGTECCRIRIERADDGGGRQRCGLAQGSLKGIFSLAWKYLESIHMYRLCIGYVSVILYAGCGKDSTKTRQNFGIFSGYFRDIQDLSKKESPYPWPGRGDIRRRAMVLPCQETILCTLSAMVLPAKRQYSDSYPRILWFP